MTIRNPRYPSNEWCLSSTNEGLAYCWDDDDRQQTPLHVQVPSKPATHNGDNVMLKHDSVTSSLKKSNAFLPFVSCLPKKNRKPLWS